MFLHSLAFDQPLNGWQVGQVTNMYGMFYRRLGSINNWMDWTSAVWQTWAGCLHMHPRSTSLSIHGGLIKLLTWCTRSTVHLRLISLWMDGKLVTLLICTPCSIVLPSSTRISAHGIAHWTSLMSKLCLQNQTVSTKPVLLDLPVPFVQLLTALPTNKFRFLSSVIISSN